MTAGLTLLKVTAGNPSKGLIFFHTYNKKDKGRGHRIILLESSLKQEALHLRPVAYNKYSFDYILVKVGCIVLRI